MEQRYENILSRVLDQNALILNSVSRMQEDLKNLRTKLETLEKEPIIKGDSNSTTDDFQEEEEIASSSTELPPLSFPYPYQYSPQSNQEPPYFINPFTHPFYPNPYMMPMPISPNSLNNSGNSVLNPAMFSNLGNIFGQGNKPPTAATLENTEPASVQGPPGTLKRQEEEWSCTVCFIANSKDVISCVACTTPKPTNIPVGNFSPLTATTTSTQQPADTSSDNLSAPKFSFGIFTPTASPLSSLPLTTTTSSFGSFSFGSSKIVTTTPFSWTPNPAAATTTTTSTSAFQTAPPSSLGQGSSLFSSPQFFQSRPAAPVYENISPPPADRHVQFNVPADPNEDLPPTEFEPTAEFEPVIPLPPLVEVIKGDENENILFEHRAKLLRFVKETKEWKERGLGDIKILQSKVHTQKIRVVMWREKVHKIACNHWITKDMEITNYNENLKNLMWTALDFAEEDPKTEIFVCRFGQEEKAQEFKLEMENAINLMKNASATSSPAVPAPRPTSPSQLVKPLSQLFKKPEGEWTCDACYCSNNKNSSQCISCSTPKPGSSSSHPEKLENASTFILQETQNDGDSNRESSNHHHEPPCLGCDSESFDFSKLNGREVPNFEDIPKPHRPDNGENITGKLNAAIPSSLSPAENKSSSLLSNFSFTLASTPVSNSNITSITNANASPFASNFSFTFSNDNALGNKSIFGGNNGPVTLNPLNLNESGDHVQEQGYSYEAEEGEGDDDDDDGDDETMFESDGHAFLKESDDGEFEDYGDGQVTICYDGDHYCTRFIFQSSTNDDHFVDHFIASETEVKSAGNNTFEWNFINMMKNHGSEKSRIRVIFKDQQDFDLFSSVISESVDMAKQAGVTEQDLRDDLAQADE